MSISVELRPEFSKHLIRYRKAKGFSQEKLAEVSGVSRRVIAYYETQVSNPPLDNIIALSKALGISISELIGESENEFVKLFENVDTRTLKKIMLINKLSKRDRNVIYNMIDAMLQKGASVNTE